MHIFKKSNAAFHCRNSGTLGSINEWITNASETTFVAFSPIFSEILVYTCSISMYVFIVKLYQYSVT